MFNSNNGSILHRFWDTVTCVKIVNILTPPLPPVFNVFVEGDGNHVRIIPECSLLPRKLERRGYQLVEIFCRYVQPFWLKMFSRLNY